jgi:putative resolvase
MDKYIPAKDALKVLKVHYQTLYKLEQSGKLEVIKTPGGKRLYNVKKFIRDNKIGKSKTDYELRRKICYCRVSSKHQEKDLERQIEYMEEHYPDYEIIKDIGSGLNFGRKGLKEIIDSAIKGEIEEIVIAYKDRLCRFGYEMIERLIEDYSDGKITVINAKEETPQEEITKDIIQIMNVYTAKINGLRKYKKKIQKLLEKK